MHNIQRGAAFAAPRRSARNELRRVQRLSSDPLEPEPINVDAKGAVRPEVGLAFEHELGEAAARQLDLAGCLNLE
jgi:hypothetical protein